MNKCFLVGNLTRDPETTTTSTGITVCKFGLAVTRTFTNAAGERETDFFNIVAWRGLGDNCGKFLSKGSKVAISGRIEIRTFEKDGVKQYYTDIVADDVEFLSPKGQTQMQDGGYQPPSGGGGGVKKPASELKPVEDDGLPF